MASPEWAQLGPATVLGRPIEVWQRRPRTVGDVMALSVGRDEDEFLVQGERRFTFAAFRAAVEAGAAELAGTGVAPGQRVLIVLYNSPEFWLAQCAAWRLGAVPVLGNRWWSAGELADAIRRTGPALVVTDLPLPAAGVSTLPPTEVAVWWTLPAPPQRVPVPDAAIDEDDVAVIVFTAGSTGAPKGVQLSHRVIAWTQQTIHVMRGARPLQPPAAGKQKVALTTTPLFHNGSMVATLGAYLEGSKVVMLAGRYDPAEVMRLIERERVSAWSAVPTMFTRLLLHPDLPKHDLSSLVAPASGGSAVTAEFVAELAARLPGAARGLVSGYGMTEMSFLTMVGAADLQARPGTVGRLLPGVEMRVVDPGAESSGELVARSGALMVGYLDGDDRPIDAAGWYHTGDLGRIDGEGFVFLTGRAKDMVIRGGENISCPHVEQALLTHEDVLEAAVVAVPDADFGEVVGAVVYLRPGAVLAPAALERHARARLAYFAVPAHWRMSTRPLPVLPTGKIDKPRLRREFFALAEPAALPEGDRG